MEEETRETKEAGDKGGMDRETKEKGRKGNGGYTMERGGMEGLVGE